MFGCVYGRNNDERDIYSINTTMAITNKQIKSINDFSAKMLELNKKYDIKNFIDESTSVFEKYEHDKTKIQKIYQDPNEMAVFIQELDLTSEGILEIIEETKKIQSKFHYSEYLEEASELRTKYINGRKNYYYNQISFLKSKEFAKILDLSFLEESMVSTWILSALYNNKNTIYEIVYEDVDGNIVSTDIQHRGVDIPDNYEYIEAPLIDRTTGITSFDSFLLKSFYDVIQKKWILIPVRNILSIKNHEGQDLHNEPV